MDIVVITGFFWILVIALHSITRRFLSSNLSSLPPVHSSPIPPVSKIEYYLIFFILIAACLLRLSGMTRSLFYDEIITADFFVENGSIWKAMSTQVALNNHIGYSIMARAFEFIFGKSEWALRLPALLMGLGSIYAVWVFGRSIFNPSIALVGAFILMLSPEHVLWSGSARGYTGLMFFGLLANHFYFKLLEKPSQRTAFAFIFSSVMALYVHLYGVFIPFIQVIYTVIFVWKKKVSRASFISVWDSLLKMAVVTYLLYSPLIFQMTETIRSHGRAVFLPIFPIQVFTMFCGYGEPALQGLIFLVFVFGSFFMKRNYPDKLLFLVLLIMLPLLIVWFSRPFAFFPRFFVYFLPYFGLILAAGFIIVWKKIGTDRPRSLFLKVLYGLFVLSILVSWVVNVDKRLVREGFREAVQFMEKDAGPDEITCAIGYGAELFQHYANRTIFVPGSERDLDMIKRNIGHVRCAYRQRDWEPSLHTQIAQFLSEHAQSQEFPGIIVFYPKKD